MCSIFLATKKNHNSLHIYLFGISLTRINEMHIQPVLVAKSKSYHFENLHIRYFNRFWFYLVLKLPCMRPFLAKLCMNFCFKTKTAVSFKIVIYIFFILGHHAQRKLMHFELTFIFSCKRVCRFRFIDKL